MSTLRTLVHRLLPKRIRLWLLERDVSGIEDAATEFLGRGSLIEELDRDPEEFPPARVLH